MNAHVFKDTKEAVAIAQVGGSSDMSVMSPLDMTCYSFWVGGRKEYRRYVPSPSQQLNQFKLIKYKRHNSVTSNRHDLKISIQFKILRF